MCCLALVLCSCEPWRAPSGQPLACCWRDLGPSPRVARLVPRDRPCAHGTKCVQTVTHLVTSHPGSACPNACTHACTIECTPSRFSRVGSTLRCSKNEHKWQLTWHPTPGGGVGGTAAAKRPRLVVPEPNYALERFGQRGGGGGRRGGEGKWRRCRDST